MDWIAFDYFEPIGTRTTPQLLAELIALTANVWRKEGARPFRAADFLLDPFAAPRVSVRREEERKGEIIGDYRRLRAERLAARAASDSMAATSPIGSA